MAQPIFSLATDSFPNELEITAIDGNESISHFFELTIHFKIKKETADLAILATGKILDSEIDVDADKKLIDKYLAEVE